MLNCDFKRDAMTDITPVILCGGAGTRLWPLSREYYPKQLLKIENNYSLLQNTLLRIGDLNCQRPLLICNEEHRFLVAQHLHEISCAHQGIILEPFGKNTAPALAIAALHLIKENPEAVLLVFFDLTVAVTVPALPSALKDADITVSSLAVNGTLRGNVEAREKIDIGKTGSIVGDIKTPLLNIESGAKFSGNCLM